jgi:hypothetical protein
MIASHSPQTSQSCLFRTFCTEPKPNFNPANNSRFVNDRMDNRLRLRKGEDDSRKILFDAFFIRNVLSVSGLCIGGITIEYWTPAQVVPIVRFNNGLERFMFPEAFEMTITNVGTCFRVQVSQSCAMLHRNCYMID